MKSFKFRLDGLLNYRESVEDMLKKEFSSIQTQLEKEEKKLSEFIKFYMGEIERLLKKDKFSSSEIGLYRTYFARIKEIMKERRLVVKRFQEMHQEKQKELLYARKERKVLDLMKEKNIKEHTKLEIKDEQTLLDEFNSNRFHKSAL